MERQCLCHSYCKSAYLMALESHTLDKAYSRGVPAQVAFVAIDNNEREEEKPLELSNEMHKCSLL